MKKAQVTLFIILGIVIVIAFFILFSLSQGLTEEQKQVLGQARIQVSSDAVNRYISACLDNSFEKAVLELAHNGGWIYEIAGCNANTCTTGNIENASYGITLNPEIDMTPKYPCLDATESWPFCKFYYDKENRSLSVYGKKRLPALDSGPNSIKRQLEIYTEQKVLECINFSQISGFAAQPFNIDIMQAEVEVSIRSMDTRATLNLPVLIKYQGRSVTEMQTFSIEKKIRLSLMHKFIDQLLFYDNSDIGFDIATDYTNLTWYFGGMRFNISYNRKAFDDFIIISDNESIVRNKPLEFRIARQNLPPVLNYISGFSTRDFDFILFDNQTLIITPEAFDVNEDNLQISYSGWKFDYDEIFSGSTPEKVNISTPVAVRSGDNISIQLTKQDLGMHNITVSVTDGEYTDYQLVRILIDDQIHLEVFGSNPYANISNEFASIEDPYFFEAVTTDIFNSGANTYEWVDPIEPPVLYKGPDPAFWIPGPEDKTVLFYEQVNIGKIENPFNVANTTHNIMARVTGASIGDWVNQDSELLAVRVRECLAHESDIPPFPYNEIINYFDDYGSVSADPFRGSHTCCIGGYPGEWRVGGPSTVCYNMTQYGMFSLFAEPELISDTYPGLPDSYPDNGDENDIYVRKYHRFCDGKRGNMCAGSDIDTIKLYRQCNICQAPPRLYSLSSQPMECFNYEGLTYQNEPCDYEWKCSNNTYGDGAGQLCQGGCDGAGSCLGMVYCQEPENDTRHMQCFQRNDYTFYTNNCSCEIKTGNDEITCAEIDLDASIELCDICSGQSIEWIGGRCCGDDKYEYIIDSVCCDQIDDCVQDGICYNKCFEIGGNICKNNQFQPRSFFDFLIC